MDQLEHNKQTVLDFYQNVVNQRNFTGAAKHLGQTYIQHRADADDGVAGLQAFIGRMQQRYPDSHCDIKRVFADGDFVILQVHVVRVPGDRGSVHVDIFRVADRKVVEHWDVDQPIPEHFVHANGPF